MKKNNLKFWKIAFSVISIILVILIAFKIITNDPLAINASDHMHGNENAKITIIEYSDFECPYCAIYSSFLNQLHEEFPNDILIIYRQFPLQSIHINAYNASKASEAAGRQEKFWEMHDLLFKNQEIWSKMTYPENAFKSYAQELQLDIDKFLADFESKEVENKVNKDLKSAFALKLNATPTLFLNGEKIKNPGSYEGLKLMVNS